MGYTVSMVSEFSGEHMGLTFAKGKAHTDDAFLATRLRSKGYAITADEDADDADVPEQEAELTGKAEKAKGGRKKNSAPEEPSELPPLDGDE